MIRNLNVKKNAITAVVAFFINILLTFIGYKLLISHGGLEVLGVWSILTAAIFILRVGDIGMGGAAERYTAIISIESNAKEIREYFDTALITNVFIFTLLAIFGCILFYNNIQWFVPDNKNLEIQALEVLPLIFTTFLVSNIANIFNGGLRGLHLGYLNSYLLIISNAVQMILIISLVPKIGLKGLALGQLGQYFFLMTTAYICMNRHIRKYKSMSWLPIYFRRNKFKELINFSIKAQAVSLLNGLFEPLSKFLVGHTAGLSILGLYELAYKIVSLPRNAVVAGVLGVMPAVTNLLTTNVSEAQKLYFKSKNLVTVATSFVLIGVVIFSPVISWLLFEKIEWTLIYFIIIMAIAFIGNVIGAPAYLLGFSSGRFKFNLISSILVIFITLIMTLIMTRFIPDYAAIFSSACGLLFGGIFIAKYNQEILRNIK